jgi:hypothetical protein
MASGQRHFGIAYNPSKAQRGVHSGWLVNKPFTKPISILPSVSIEGETSQENADAEEAGDEHDYNQ